MPPPDWLGDSGPIARRLQGFEVRPQQREMATAAAEALEQGHHLAVEAGTGVGKTFAYLLPAIDQVRCRKRRVVVSTHTIALQEQLIDKDIPFLRQALGAAFTAELVKGRSNYLCLRRLQSASARQKTLFAMDSLLSALHAIEDWAYQTQDGSLSDLPETPPPEVWEKVRSEHGNCLGRRCPSYLTCFYQRARRRAEAADLLVVNHALLVSDLLLRREGASVLPDYDLAVIDEAHTLAQVATDHLSTSVSSGQVQRVLAALFNERTGKGYLAELGDDAQRQAVIAAQSACTRLFGLLAGWQQRHGRANGRLVAPPAVKNPLSSALAGLAELLLPLKTSLPREEDQQELGAHVNRIVELAQALNGLLTQAYEAHVYWLEVEPRHTRSPSRVGDKRIALWAAPLDPGPFLRELLFDRTSSVILTSATLAIPRSGSGTSGAPPPAPSTTGPDGEQRLAAADASSAVEHDSAFDYLLDRLGNPPARTLRLGSPFDFQHQVTVYVEAGLPEPSAGHEFVEAAARAIVHYLRETEGRAFVLFTSYQMLDQAARIVRDDLRADGYTILAQGETLSRSKMLARLRQTPRTAIFGTDSFWQGVDVVGEALSNVTIVKLPFAVPDRPMIEARIEQIRQRGGNPFYGFQLPEAVLKFRQGFGRLIRSRTDRGIVAILDPRVVTKAYGRLFLDSLPPCRVEISRQPW